jgi:homoserine dehydrogenase
MDSAGTSYSEALEEATRLGYAEADPTADVDGFDAASKAAILASLAFHTRVTTADVHRAGIGAVSSADVAAARELGRTVKLLELCERVAGHGGAESVSVRVYPAMIPRSHPLASVEGPYNAVFVEAEAAGQVMFYGRGAGGAPTASAVLGDLVAVARNLLAGGHGPRESAYAALPVAPMGQTPTRYHVSLDVADRPGVLAQVATVFAAHGVSISVVRQAGAKHAERAGGSEQGSEANLVVVTHAATDASLAATVDEVGTLDSVREVVSVMRVEGQEP